VSDVFLILEVGEERSLVKGKCGHFFFIRVGALIIGVPLLAKMCFTTLFLLEELLVLGEVLLLLVVLPLLFLVLFLLIWAICNEVPTLATIIAISFCPPFGTLMPLVALVVAVSHQFAEVLHEKSHVIIIKT
jgi:hypothetical protein